MQGTVALVAGASGGIGRVIAAELLSSGSEVILLGRNLAKLTAAIPPCNREMSSTLVADLTDAAAIKNVGLEISMRGRLDVLILSSGVYERSEDPDVFRHQIDANVLGPYALVRTLLPTLLESQGYIIFVNSSQALRAAAPVGQYAATMHAMKAVADALRDEVNSKGVRVTSLYLGRTAGERQHKLFACEGRVYPPEKLMQPADVARTVTYLLQMPKTAEVTDLTIRPTQKT